MRIWPIDSECFLCLSMHSPDAVLVYYVHLRAFVCLCVVLIFLPTRDTH